MKIELFYSPVTCAMAPYINLTEANAEFEVHDAVRQQFLDLIAAHARVVEPLEVAERTTHGGADG